MRQLPGPEAGLDEELAEDELGDEELPPSERARMRRRDHDASAHDRELMNDGSAKWFRQALDHQARAGRDGRSQRRGA